jgi:hypothetical protein
MFGKVRRARRQFELAEAERMLAEVRAENARLEQERSRGCQLCEQMVEAAR